MNALGTAAGARILRCLRKGNRVRAPPLTGACKRTIPKLVVEFGGIVVDPVEREFRVGLFATSDTRRTGTTR
jgi:hypothetical protein